MRRAIAFGLLAVLALGGTAVGRSPVTSPAAVPTPSAPAASVPATSPDAGPTFSVTAVHWGTCAAGTTCAWYLTLLNASDPAASLLVHLVPDQDSRLVPALRTPTTIGRGTYLVEASQWQIPPAEAQGPSSAAGRLLSCSTQLDVAGQLAVSIEVQFGRDDCTFVIGEMDS